LLKKRCAEWDLTWRPPFVRHPTVEEAVRDIDWVGGVFWEWGWRAAGCWADGLANHLEAAAALSCDGQVWLNLEDAHTLSTWLS
jgi:hypothetical protein